MKKVQPLEKTSWTSIQNQVLLGPKGINFNKALTSMNYLSKSAKVQIVAPGGTNARLGSAARTA